jgi:hypothetical protein
LVGPRKKMYLGGVACVSGGSVNFCCVLGGPKMPCCIFVL